LKEKEVLIAMAIRSIVWIARVAGAGALLLGVVFWIAQRNVLLVHMASGLILALALLVLGFVLVFTRGIRLLGAIGIGYALILSTLGFTQTRILVGSMHWLIQTAHLLIGIGALALVQSMAVRYERLRQTSATDATSQATLP
jgi:hypothetical protein